MGWRGGGGLPLPKPHVMRHGNTDTGEGCERLMPGGLVERIVHVSDEGPQGCKVEYTVDNPGLLSFYPVALHRGCVEFQDVGQGCTELTWSVHVVPLPFFAWYAEVFTQSVVNTLVSNLVAHLDE